MDTKDMIKSISREHLEHFMSTVLACYGSECQGNTEHFCDLTYYITTGEDRPDLTVEEARMWNKLFGIAEAEAEAEARQNEEEEE